MSQMHPSDWKIKKASTERFCQTLLLPLGPGIPPTQISSRLFNKIYDIWGPHPDSHRVGVFAQVLREIRSSKIDLGSLPQINAKMVVDCYNWLDAYELKLVEFGKQRQQEDKALAAPQPVPLAELKSTDPYLYGKLLVAAVEKYILMAGPMGDAKLIAEKAKAVARACTEE